MSSRFIRGLIQGEMFSVWKPDHSSATISHQEFIPERSLSCVLSVGTGLLKAIRRRRHNAPMITQYVDSKKNTWLSGGLTLNHLWSGYWWGPMKCRHPLMHVRSVLLCYLHGDIVMSACKSVPVFEVGFLPKIKLLIKWIVFIWCID